jgi:glucokinase
MSDQPLAIGVDLGGTKIGFALADAAGNVLATHQLPTLPAEGADAVIDRIAQGVNHLLQQRSGQVVGIGVCSPGQVDPDTGMVYYATNLAWENVDLRGGLYERLPQPLPVFLQKDANAQALGEMVYGAARGVRDFMLMAIGTGLGGGAVTGGRVITGANFNPTEVGHLSLDPEGRQCACGLRGCPEIYVSGVGFRAAVAEYRSQYPDSALAALPNADASDVMRFAPQGDPLALRVLHEGGQWLGAIAACCAGILNPAMIVLGGGLGLAAADYLLPEAERELKRRVLPATYEKLVWRKSQLANSALGAAALVWVGLELV